MCPRQQIQTFNNSQRTMDSRSEKAMTRNRERVKVNSNSLSLRKKVAEARVQRFRGTLS